MTAKRLSVLWLALWVLLAVLAHFKSNDYQLSQVLCSPSRSFPWGCDSFGRSLIWLIPRASLLSLGFSLTAVAACCALALSLGLFLALSPKTIRFIGLRILETILIFPPILIALAWASVRGPGWITLSFALLMNVFPSMTRLVYVRTQELLAEDFLLAARATGASPLRIAIKQLLPALLSVCAVAIPGLFAYSLLAEATLSFLGVGVPIGHDSWGSLLAQGKDYLLEAPFISFTSGIPLVLTVLSLQLLSEDIR